MFLLEALNIGFKPVKIVAAGIILPNGDKGYFLEKLKRTVEFPHKLGEGENCISWIEAKALAQQMNKMGFSGKVNLIGFYTDAIDNTYKGKLLKFNIKEWL